MKYSHHFEIYGYAFQHPLCRMWRPYILDNDKYSNYNKTHICILLYVGIYIYYFMLKQKKKYLKLFWWFFWQFLFFKWILFPKYISLNEKKLAQKHHCYQVEELEWSIDSSKLSQRCGVSNFRSNGAMNVESNVLIFWWKDVKIQ